MPHNNSATTVEKKVNSKVIGLNFVKVKNDFDTNCKDLLAKTPLLNSEYLVENRGDRWTATFNFGQSCQMLSGKQANKNDAMDLCKRHFNEAIAGCLKVA